MTDTPATAGPAEFWEARYRDSGPVWSGRPNELLVREVAGLEPGTALDLGAGRAGTRSGWPPPAGG